MAKHSILILYLIFNYIINNMHIICNSRNSVVVAYFQHYSVVLPAYYKSVLVNVGFMLLFCLW